MLPIATRMRILSFRMLLRILSMSYHAGKWFC